MALTVSLGARRGVLQAIARLSSAGDGPGCKARVVAGKKMKMRKVGLAGGREARSGWLATAVLGRHAAPLPCPSAL